MRRSRLLSPQALTLDHIDDHPVGGKARGLARLRGAGLRVPDAFVVVGASPGRLPADLDERLAELDAPAVAVRSSAIDEDGDDASFAGQYETVLEVCGADAVRAAIGHCLRSARGDRANAYRESRHEGDGGGSRMSIVVQRMVTARASGVCFTADPVTSRRGRLVIDSVPGLGEALVSGHVSPDQDQLQRARMRWEPRRLEGVVPAISIEERDRVASEALEAERCLGEPLDLEWAIDVHGDLFWLQARPITALGADPQALDTRPLKRGDVYTRCNVGEMMPGAISPLTFSVCARGIDVGWQDNMIALGLAPGRVPENVYVAMSHGHLFINLSEGARFNSAVVGSSPDQQSLAICGRIVPEVVAPDPPPLRIRLPRIVRQVLSILRARHHIRAMEGLVACGEIRPGDDARATWQSIDARREDLFESYARHLTVSSGAGALAPILLQILAGDEEPTQAHHAAVAHLLSGARDVESADIVQGVQRILETFAGDAAAARAFSELAVEDALRWLRADASGRVGREFAAYLDRHGHRSLRELDVRQPEWAHDPSPLIRSLQAQLRFGRSAIAGVGGPGSPAQAAPVDARRLQWLTRIAHAAVRNRERSKSLLVATTVHVKRAYRALASQLVAEGRLPDEDAVFFLLHEELGELTADAPGSRFAEEAVARRTALSWQESLQFPEVSVGMPEPEQPEAAGETESVIWGKPVSRGRAEGRARVVRTLEEAEALEPGEILVAPVTDVGWTPYFAIISGLVTDVGSAVSHGAVVAREYGLPAVLNTRHATRTLKTGDRIRLDGDLGRVEVLDGIGSTKPAP
ncbi:MAG: pyruvate, water dikinase [Deltaproteobacteria bacterium]|nr:pyruvate, water dikinase [Deltaproteobacteria bacterium]